MKQYENLDHLQDDSGVDGSGVDDNVIDNHYQSWQSLLYRAQLCQDLWQRWNDEYYLLLNNQSNDNMNDNNIHDQEEYNDLSHQVDTACRRAKELAYAEKDRIRLLQQQQQQQLQQQRQRRQHEGDDDDDDDDEEEEKKDDTAVVPVDLVERLFFTNSTSRRRMIVEGDVDDEDDEANDNDNNNEDEFDDDYDDEVDDNNDNILLEEEQGANNVRNMQRGKRRTTTTASTQQRQHQSHQSQSQQQSMEELQHIQREQMEDAIGQMARQMKDATKGISNQLQQQNVSTLVELETIAEQNMNDVSSVTKNVMDHNKSSRIKNWANWTFLLMLVGIFCLCMVIIFTIPKSSSNACIFYCGQQQRPSIVWRIVTKTTRGIQTLSTVVAERVQQQQSLLMSKNNDRMGDSPLTNVVGWDEIYDEDDIQKREKERLDMLLATMKKQNNDMTKNDANIIEEERWDDNKDDIDQEDNGPSIDNPWGIESVDDNGRTGGAGEGSGGEELNGKDNPWGLDPEDDDDGRQNDLSDRDNPWGLDSVEVDYKGTVSSLEEHHNHIPQREGRNVDANHEESDIIGHKPIAPEDVNMDEILASLRLMAQAAEAVSQQEAKNDDENNILQQQEEPVDHPTTLSDRFDPTNAFERDGVANERFSPRDVRVAAATNDVETLQRYITISPHFIDRQDKHGWAAIHLATRAGHEATIRLLLEYGCDARIENTAGQTPYQVAIDTFGPTHPISRLLSTYLEGGDINNNNDDTDAGTGGDDDGGGITNSDIPTDAVTDDDVHLKDNEVPVPPHEEIDSEVTGKDSDSQNNNDDDDDDDDVEEDEEDAYEVADEVNDGDDDGSQGDKEQQAQESGDDDNGNEMSEDQDDDEENARGGMAEAADDDSGLDSETVEEVVPNEKVEQKDALDEVKDDEEPENSQNDEDIEAQRADDETESADDHDDDDDDDNQSLVLGETLMPVKDNSKKRIFQSLSDDDDDDMESLGDQDVREQRRDQLLERSLHGLDGVKKAAPDPSSPIFSPVFRTGDDEYDDDDNDDTKVERGRIRLDDLLRARGGNYRHHLGGAEEL